MYANGSLSADGRSEVNYGKCFAWLPVTLDTVAAGGYAIQHDWRKMMYWCCACIQASVTY